MEEAAAGADIMEVVEADIMEAAEAHIMEVVEAVSMAATTPTHLEAATARRGRRRDGHILRPPAPTNHQAAASQTALQPYRPRAPPTTVVLLRVAEAAAV